MPLTKAEKQKRYRERKKAEDPEAARLKNREHCRKYRGKLEGARKIDFLLKSNKRKINFRERRRELFNKGKGETPYKSRQALGKEIQLFFASQEDIKTLGQIFQGLWKDGELTRARGIQKCRYRLYIFR